MKKHIAALSILLSTTLLSAADDTQEQLQIRSMIQEIQQADEGERYQKMNEFKTMLRSMNEETRKNAISELQQTMKNDGAPGTRTQTRTRTRTHAGDENGEMTQTRERRREMQNQQLHQQTQQQNKMQMQNQQQMQQMQQMGGDGTGKRQRRGMQ